MNFIFMAALYVGLISQVFFHTSVVVVGKQGGAGREPKVVYPDHCAMTSALASEDGQLITHQYGPILNIGKVLTSVTLR